MSRSDRQEPSRSSSTPAWNLDPTPETIESRLQNHPYPLGVHKQLSNVPLKEQTWNDDKAQRHLSLSQGVDALLGDAKLSDLCLHLHVDLAIALRASMGCDGGCHRRAEYKGRYHAWEKLHPVHNALNCLRTCRQI